MDNIQDVADLRSYLERAGFICSNEGDSSDWFWLEIRLNGREFHISVSLSNFRNSPSQTRRFWEYWACLKAISNRNSESAKEGKNENAVTESDCFEWAVNPYIELFKSLAPPPAAISTLTLQHFFYSESFECELGAVDDCLVPGPIEPYERKCEWTPPAGSGRDPKDSPWTTAFPSFSANQVQVVCDKWDGSYGILNMTPDNVAVDGQFFYFKTIEPRSDGAVPREVKVYEQIARASFGSDVRTSRLYGVVLDENQQLIGLLLHPIAVVDALEHTLGPETPQSLKERWTEQIQATLGALHDSGIAWGDAQPGNVVIDIHSDAWIVGFGDSYRRGWVDMANAGSIAGDLEGLKKLLEFISTGTSKYPLNPPRNRGPSA